MHVLRFGNKLNEEVCRGFIFANLFNSLYLLVRLWWNILVANLATNFQDLVAKVENVVALAPVSGAISRLTGLEEMLILPFITIIAFSIYQVSESAARELQHFGWLYEGATFLYKIEVFVVYCFPKFSTFRFSYNGYFISKCVGLKRGIWRSLYGARWVIKVYVINYFYSYIYLSIYSINC